MVSFLKKNEGSERGSIMLEVIAVLALMGVMGAMLFRQISQRNQELHNIQMASEIRTIKEAFSAYIQAERSYLLTKCNDLTQPLNYCAIGANPEQTSAALATSIKEYLPNGWFDDGLAGYYTFSLWTYIQNDATQKQVMYGVIVPTENTLPRTNWNFKRAARVALLIGADGGVYDKGMTPLISGSLGSWHLDPEDEMVDKGNWPDNSTYVAMTAMDVYTPEYELPQGEVNLPPNWDLALQNLHAWNHFSVGNKAGVVNGCYEVRHGGTTAGLVNNDSVPPSKTYGTNCQPLFFVDNSHVFANNDLEVGTIKDDGTTETNVKLTQEGIIQQMTKDATNKMKGITIDPDGRIIMGASKQTETTSGERLLNERYVVDPAYTSNMNDIRLASRGGARLSDILPDYILKGQRAIHDSNAIDVDIPVCPTGYRAALLVLPVSWNQNVALKVADAAGNLSDIAEGSFPTKIVQNTTLVTKGDIEGNLSADVTDGSISANNDFKASDNIAGTADLRNLRAEPKPGVCVKVTRTGTTTTDGRMVITDLTAANKWQVTLGYNNDKGNCTPDDTVNAITQTYCVWADSGIAVPDTDNENACKQAGFSWTAKGCRYVYPAAATTINTSPDIPDKNRAAVCKAAGFKWTKASNAAGGTCN